MEALAPMPIENWIVEFTRHCVERFRERFCPALDLLAAEARIEQVLDYARLEPWPPSWVVAPEPAAAYLVVGDDLALPLVERGSEVLVARTCLPRGGITRAARERRNERRARRGRARR